MKYLITLVMFAFTIDSYSQIVDIPNEKFLHALIDKGVDLNADSLIQLTEAEVVTRLSIRDSELTDVIGISSFINLEELILKHNYLTEIELSTLVSLRVIMVQNNMITDLDLSSQVLADSIYFSSNEMVNVILPEAINLKLLYTHNNPNYVLPNLSFYENLEELSCFTNIIDDLNMSEFKKLKILNARWNVLNRVELDGLQDLNDFDLFYSKIESIHLNDLPSLDTINLDKCETDTLIVTNVIVKDTVMLGEIDHAIMMNNVTKIESINRRYHDLKIVELKNLPDLRSINFLGNDISRLVLDSLPLLSVANLGSNYLLESNSVFKDLDLLEDLNLSNNRFERIPESIIQLENIKILNFGSNSIDSVFFQNSNLLSLENLDLERNAIKEIKLANLPNLHTLNLDRNYNLHTLEFIDVPNIANLECFYNDITEIDVSDLKKLQILDLSNSELSVLDLSHNSALSTLSLNSNSLSYLNLLNGSILDYFAPGFINIDVLCADEDELDELLNEIDGDTQVNTLCNAALGGIFGELRGNISYDEFGDCEMGATVEILKFDLSSTGGTGSAFPTYTEDGYNVYLGNGDYELRPKLNNTALFSITPELINIEISDSVKLVEQDFCVTPFGESIVDLTVNLLPLDVARPGFESSYKVIVENFGNIKASGKAVIAFDGELMTFLSSSSMVGISQDHLTWNFENVNPFEELSLIFDMRLNSPMDSPPLNGGEILEFISTVESENVDINQLNDSHVVRQDVVNSYDPNDKVCLQGDVLMDDMIGSFVEYRIRFENTGTGAAVNITVKDKIDIDKFDITTLEIIDASHPVFANVRNDVIEFIFKDIYLPFHDDNNDGYVIFKIKTLDNLVVGDALTNTADIFFDFNWPIVTNTATTQLVTDMDGDGFHNLIDCDDTDSTINPAAIDIPGNGIDEDCDGEDLFSSTSSADDLIFSIQPNPASNYVTISGDTKIKQIEVFNLNGKLMIVQKNERNRVINLDVQNLQPGMYMIELSTERNQKIVEKLMIVD